MANEASRWAAALKHSSRPAYLAIADAISDDIQSGRLVAHQKLPTMRGLARVLDLNFTTISRGYAEAQRRGLVDARAGSGTFVRESIPTGPVRHAERADLIDMTMNMPPEPRAPELLQRLREGITGLAQDLDPYEWLRYEPFGGRREDREAGATWLQRLIPGVDSSRVLVCSGVQGTLLAVFSMLARPGESIACEAVTYPGIKGIAAQLGIRLIGLTADREGLDPAAFAAACAADPPKALYLNPILNNPTTATLPLERRIAITDIARRYNVPIIEDDPYSCLPDAPPPTIAAMAPELTFYVTGFAKCVGAGLRIAYLVVPNSRFGARLSSILRTTTVMAAPLMTRLATRWIQDGTTDAIVEAIRHESKYRQSIAARALRAANYESQPEAFHLWLQVPEPWSRIEFATHLRSHGVGVVVADTFTVAGSVPEAVRVCLGGPIGREDCTHMLELIEDAAQHAPAIASRVM